MTVKLTQHAAELLEAMRVQRDESAEVIVEHALEMLASGLDVNPAELGVRASVLELQGLGKGIW